MQRAPIERRDAREAARPRGQSTPDRARLSRLIRSHVDDWAEVRLHTGENLRGWVFGSSGDRVSLCHDLYRQDTSVHVPLDDIASIEFTGNSLRWVVPWRT